MTWCKAGSLGGNKRHEAKKGKDLCEYHAKDPAQKCKSKIAYSQERAYRAAQELGQAAYRCPFCNDWHTSTKT